MNSLINFESEGPIIEMEDYLQKKEKKEKICRKYSLQISTS